MGEVSAEKLQGYLDGFKAALDIAKSVQLRVAPDIDPAIQLGVRTVSMTLQNQYDAFLSREVT
jgi:hypothetical protein